MMKSLRLVVMSLSAVLLMPLVVQCDIYYQNFDDYLQDSSIGTTNPVGPSNSSEQVTTVAKMGSTGKGWNTLLICNSGNRERFYDSGSTFLLTDSDSFTFAFWVNPYTKANSAANCGFIGLFNSQSTSGSSNGLASMKYFLGINLGGVGTNRDPAIAFQADFQGGGHQQVTTTSTIVGGLNQWYEVEINYDAEARTFNYSVYNASQTQLITDTYTISGSTTFTLDSFGASNGLANDGRATYAYVDDVTIVPEPITATLCLIGGACLIRRRK